MTDSELVLNADVRDIAINPKKFAQESKVPGVVYGKSVDPTPLVVDYNSLHKTLQTAGTNRIIELKVGDTDGYDVLFKDVDYHPVTNRIRHFDFFAVTRGEKVQTDVPIELVGSAPAEQLGFQLQQMLDSVEVVSVPRKIPQHFEVNIDELKAVGDSITVESIQIKDSDIEIMTDPETVIIKVEAIKDLKVEDDSPTEMPSADDASSGTTDATEQEK